MKLPGSILAAVLICSYAAPASAQQQTQADSAAEAPESMQTVTVKARRFHVEPQEFKDYEYEYGLDNGEAVRFSRRVGRFYVAIKGQPKVEIFPTAAERFETREGAELVFTENGEYLTIDHYERLQLASGVPIARLQAAPK